MINQLSAVGSRQSVERQQSGGRGQGADEVTDRRRAGFEKVAKEMESLFAYQLVKVMRETADSTSSEKKGQGYDTYMSLFDMEISKLFAERGLGLQDAIIRWMERMPDINNTGNK